MTNATVTIDADTLLRIAADIARIADALDAIAAGPDNFDPASFLSPAQTAELKAYQKKIGYRR